jgi:hypothetical protein
VTFISIHSVIIYVVFFGACMRCTWLCPLKPGVLQSTSPTTTLSPMQGSSTSPTAMLACTQGSGTSLPDTLAPSYTPHCTPRPSPCIYKREVQGLHAKGRTRERANEQAHSLSLSRTLVTPTTSAPPWCGITRVAFLPCVPSRANPSGLGHAATNLLVSPGTPRGRNADKGSLK